MVSIGPNQIFLLQKSEIRNSEGLKKYAIKPVNNKGPGKKASCVIRLPVKFFAQ